MITLQQIREDLRELRHYYLRKNIFDQSFVRVTSNSILKKVKIYNRVMEEAPIKLYDLYISLYANNCTQEAHAYDLGYTPQYVQQQNKKLLLYLQTKLSSAYFDAKV